MSGKKIPKQAPASLSRTAEELEKAKRTLQGVETAALSDIALVLTEAVENLSQAAKELADLQRVEWLTPEQAAKHLGCGSVKAFDKIASREGIPKHYLSARAPRYNRAELDSWLMGRR